MENENETKNETESELQNETDIKDTDEKSETENEGDNETENITEPQTEPEIQSETQSETETSNETETDNETDVHYYFDTSDEEFMEYLKAYSVDSDSDSISVQSDSYTVDEDFFYNLRVYQDEIIWYLDSNLESINNQTYDTWNEVDNLKLLSWDYYRILSCVTVINTFGIFCILGVLLANCFWHRLRR